MPEGNNWQFVLTNFVIFLPQKRGIIFVLGFFSVFLTFFIFWKIFVDF